MFDCTCPWCGGQAERAAVGTYRCGCGAIALGASVWDVDEVFDAARAHFGLEAPGPPATWLDAHGVAWERGEIVIGTEVGYHWFKRLSPRTGPG